VTEPPPAELLRRLTPIPTYRGHPATTPFDVSGVDPWGSPLALDIVGATAPVLLLFLSSTCGGCSDLWSSQQDLRAALATPVGLALVTRDPGPEDAAAITPLARPEVAPVVMSTQAYDDYRVAGPPFLVLVDARRVWTEGVAWGVDETLRATNAALAEALGQLGGAG
jgi:hypothetical protein